MFCFVISSRITWAAQGKTRGWELETGRLREVHSAGQRRAPTWAMVLSWGGGGGLALGRWEGREAGWMR